MLDRIACRADYDHLRQTFQWDCRENFNFGLDVVDRWASKRPDGPALWLIGPQGVQKRTWSEISVRSNQVAQALRGLALQQGDRVLVLLPKVVAWWETLIGLLKGGLIAMPGTSLLTTRDLEYRLRVSEAAAVVTDAEGAAKIDAIQPPLPSLRHRILVSDAPRPGWISYENLLSSSGVFHPLPPTRSNDPALIYFTSGTTGMPKMVLHTHASYGLGHAITGRLWLDLKEDDLHWNISDTGWAKAAWSSLFGPWFCGAAVFGQQSSGKFHPEEVLSVLSNHPITTLCAAPTIYRRLIQLDLKGFRPLALRHCVAAGEPLNPEVISQWRDATGLTIRDGYGQTETVLLCANFPGIDIRSGSMGLPSPGFDLAVIDDAGNRLPPGQEGRIAVRLDPQRPLGLFQEYWRNPAATEQAFQNGWYATGDCASRDEDGYFWFVGRADDVITSSAYRIGPFEVESALIEHPAVAEAAVVGKPDPLRNEIVKAYVVLAKGWQPSDELKTALQEHVKRVTAPYKYPREIEFVTDLPKTVSGKIRRIELRRRAEEESALTKDD
jgi:acyl-coenzyme A synthetase/AMP-(fatty) acid ligase